MPQIDEISSNFLASQLLELTEIPKNAWFAKNFEYHEVFNVFSPNAIINSKGEFENNLLDSEKELCSEYGEYLYYFAK